MKDINFIELQESLNIPQNKKEHLFELIEKDAHFLAENNLMDYSLLFIKTSKLEHNSQDIIRMPALVYVKKISGVPAQLELRETQNIIFRKI